tara:strand:- start:167 stop:853 length:687 start_codon:yes stop_codon:yes gene_type:complete
MNWQDEGFILSKRKFRENAIILEVFTNQFGKVNGIVYGGTSRKIKNYLQLTNKIFIVYNSKNENKIGYFKTELVEAIAPKYFDDKSKILCLNSISSMLRMLLPENQSYKNIYLSLGKFFNSLNKKDWLTQYLNWEIDLITNLGFGFDFDVKKITDLNSKKTYNLKIDNIEYKIPLFLLSRKFNDITQQELYEGLNFCRNLMENKFFIPNNIKFPQSRKLLENKFLKVS